MPHRDGVADGGERKNGQSDEEDEAGQRFGSFDLRPDQSEAETGALGVADPFFDRRPAVIERD